MTRYLVTFRWTDGHPVRNRSMYCTARTPAIAQDIVERCYGYAGVTYIEVLSVTEAPLEASA